MSGAASDKSIRRKTHARIELLEPRKLLSATGSVQIHPRITAAPHSDNSGLDGYTPQEIRHAYGFDQINFNGIQGDGRGQTIAIVAAFDHPRILADLKVFDQKFGIDDPPSFAKVSQNGGSTSSIRTDFDWAAEIALDVEWAHAIAPKANILLVEAKNDNLDNLMAAVDYARRQPNVTTVSMSWGCDEFYGQKAYDKYFTTPKGHRGVTFVAASGDDGSWYGASWPSTSANVISVGGTTLNIDQPTDTYISETPWRGSGGGTSWYVDQPAYQAGVQHSGLRSAPDVSYNANPNTGFAVYNSVGWAGDTGWSVVGGTSAGTPQWAALIAIANQGRALNNLPALDGASTTLPALYSFYDSTTYTATFNDITSRVRSFFSGSAQTGYDTVTGLGSPKADGITETLAHTNVRATVAAARAKPQSRRIKPSSRPRVTPSSRVNRASLTPGVFSAVSVGGDVLERQASVDVLFNSSRTDPADVKITPQSTIESFALESIQSRQSMDAQHSLTPELTFGDLQPVVPQGQVAIATPDQIADITDSLQSFTIPSVENLAQLQSLPSVARQFNIARIDWIAGFSDAWASIAEDHQAVELAAVNGTANVKNVRAWVITGIAASIDAAIIGAWLFNRPKRKKSPSPIQ